MSNFNFGLGEWPMENGGTATIVAIMPEPTSTQFNRIGWYLDNRGESRFGRWDKNGTPVSFAKRSKLVRPIIHEWRNEYPDECGSWIATFRQVVARRSSDCIGVMERITRPGDKPEYVFHELEKMIDVDKPAKEIIV